MKKLCPKNCMDCFKMFEIVSVSHGAVIKPSVPLCLINNKKKIEKLISYLLRERVTMMKRSSLLLIPKQYSTLVER